jgi:hypothetical protein
MAERFLQVLRDNFVTTLLFANEQNVDYFSARIMRFAQIVLIAS